MGRKFACRTAAVDKTPYNPVAVSRIVDFKDAHICRRISDYILEELTGTRHHEILVFEVIRLNAEVDPRSVVCKVRLASLNLFGCHTVGKVSAVALMPALLIAVVAGKGEFFDYFKI